MSTTLQGVKHTIVDNWDTVVNEREGDGIFQPLKMHMSAGQWHMELTVPQCHWIRMGSEVGRDFQGMTQCRKVRFCRHSAKLL